MISRRREPWGRKPPAGTLIDRAHPSANGLIAYFACNEGGGTTLRDASGRTGGAVAYDSDSVSAAWGVTPGGAGLALDGASAYAQLANGDATPGFNLTGACSFLCSFWLAASPVGTAYLTSDADSGFDYLQAGIFLDDGYLHYFNSNGGGSGGDDYDFVTGGAADEITPGNTYSGGWSRGAPDSAGNVTVWIDGQAAGTGEYHSANVPSTQRVRLLGAGYNAGAGTVDYPLQGTLLWAAFWDRALGPAEVQAFTARPFDLFLARPRGARSALSIASLARADSASGAEASSLVGSLAPSDAATGTESESGLALADGDSATGSATGAQGLDASDAAAGTDATTPTGVLSAAANAGGSETGLVGFLASDSATGTGENTLAPVTADSDAATGTESASKALSNSASDAGTGADAWLLKPRIAYAETAAGGEAESGPTAAATVADNGRGSEGPAELEASPLSDSATGAEATAGVAWLVGDSAAGDDSPSTAGALATGGDTAAATAAGAFGLAALDSAAGTESVALLNVGVTDSAAATESASLENVGATDGAVESGTTTGTASASGVATAIGAEAAAGAVANPSGSDTSAGSEVGTRGIVGADGASGSELSGGVAIAAADTSLGAESGGAGGDALQGDSGAGSGGVTGRAPLVNGSDSASAADTGGGSARQMGIAAADTSLGAESGGAGGDALQGDSGAGSGGVTGRAPLVNGSDSASAADTGGGSARQMGPNDGSWGTETGGGAGLPTIADDARATVAQGLTTAPTASDSASGTEGLAPLALDTADSATAADLPVSLTGPLAPVSRATGTDTLTALAGLPAASDGSAGSDQATGEGPLAGSDSGGGTDLPALLLSALARASGATGSETPATIVGTGAQTDPAAGAEASGLAAVAPDPDAPVIERRGFLPYLTGTRGNQMPTPQRLTANQPRPLPFFLASSLDHRAGVTGATPIVALSANAGPFAAPAGTVAELGSGWYWLNATAADVSTPGPLLLHTTAPGADPSDLRVEVVPAPGVAPVPAGYAGYPLTFLMVLASDHITGAVGLSPLPAVLLTQADGASGAPNGTVSEIGLGWYAVSRAPLDVAVPGPLLLLATASACDPTNEVYDVTGANASQ